MKRIGWTILAMVLCFQMLACIGTADAEPYSAVQFGHYPQTAAGDDNTPVDWLVLDVQGDRALLLCLYGIDTLPYNKQSYKKSGVTWETCSLRAWLNADFLNRAFTAEEQSRILMTEVDNGPGQNYSDFNPENGNNTQDKIFLLSYMEANRYLDVNFGAWDHGVEPRGEAQAFPTAYAVEKGAYASGVIIYKDAGDWWLRSMNSDKYFDEAVSVGCASDISYEDVFRTGMCVRPAMWVDLSVIR